MISRDAVTEEDLKATEEQIMVSYAGLKRAILNIPSEAAKPVTDTIREHPYASVAAAAGAGFLAFRLARQLFPVVVREAPGKHAMEVKERKKPSLASRIISRAVPIITPYIANYVQNEVSELMSRTKQHEPADQLKKDI